MSGAFDFDGALAAQPGVEGALSVTDGSLRVAGRSFARLHGAARVRLAKTGEAHVDALSGQLEGRRPRAIEVQTAIRWDRRLLRFDVSRAAVDDTQAAGEIVYTNDPVTRRSFVTYDARRLTLSPALVEEALHRRPSRAWVGRATLRSAPEGDRLNFALDTDVGPATGEARLRRDGGGALELPDVFLAVGDSHLRGAARVKNGEVVATLDEIVIQPSLVRSLSPALTPIRPMRIQGAASGPLHALELRLLATSGPSVVMVHGRVDVPARRFQFLAAFDAFQMERSKASGQVTLELSLSGRVVEGGVAGTLEVRHARGTIQGTRLYRGRLDAHLDGNRFKVDQALLDLPGVTVEAAGGGTFSDFHVKYGLVVTDALELKQVPLSLRTMIGLTQFVPGRAVEGVIKRHGGGEIVVTHTVIPPGFRWVGLFYHLLRGHVPRFTVD